MGKRLYATALTVFSGILIGTGLAMVGHTSTADATTRDQLSPSTSASVPATIDEPIPDPTIAPNPAPTPEESQVAASETKGNGYYIKAYNDMVSVIQEGETTPELIFDIHIKMLPELDQKQLIEGIYADNYEEMTKMVEDYIS